MSHAHNVARAKIIALNLGIKLIDKDTREANSSKYQKPHQGNREQKRRAAREEKKLTGSRPDVIVLDDITEAIPLARCSVCDHDRDASGFCQCLPKATDETSTK